VNVPGHPHFQEFLPMRIATALLVAAFVLTGCATAPPLPRIESSRGDRIGLLVEAGDSPGHTHIGTTVFNNFEKKYSYSWNLGEDVTRTIERTVRGAGLEVVDLRKEGLRYPDVSGLIDAGGEKWQVAPKKADAFRRLREQLGLKGVLLVKETRVMTARECSGGPCSERYADRSGLYTRSFLGVTRYDAVAAYEWNVFVLDPVADAAQVDPLQSMLSMPSASLSGFRDPEDFKNLTEAEFAPVRDAILRFVEGVAKEAVKVLNVK
jgi:hypothetical protein